MGRELAGGDLERLSMDTWKDVQAPKQQPVVEVQRMSPEK